MYWDAEHKISMLCARLPAQVQRIVYIYKDTLERNVFHISAADSNLSLQRQAFDHKIDLLPH